MPLLTQQSESTDQSPMPQMVTLNQQSIANLAQYQMQNKSSVQLAQLNHQILLHYLA